MNKTKVLNKFSKLITEEDLLPYLDDELSLTPELEDKVRKLMVFFDKSGIDYDKFVSKPNSLNLDDKKAYPNNDQYTTIPGQHNTQKWLQTVRHIYSQEKNESINKIDAIKQATNGWNLVETYDFLNWLKYYEEGAHLKYKYAQLWYENNAPGYFLHIKKDESKEADSNSVKDPAAENPSVAENKRIIEKQRYKIIGRLDSAEKLLRSPEGQMFAGKELESLMEAIYNLKKKVQLINKISSSIRLYEDLIIREANVLTRKGFVKAASVLHRVAQSQDLSDPAITPVSPNPPAQSSGLPGTLPAALPNNSPATDPNEETTDKSGNSSTVPQGLLDFFEGLKTNKVTEQDDLEINDIEDELLVTEAQIANDLPIKEDKLPITEDLSPGLDVPPVLEEIPPEAKTKKIELPLDDLSIGEKDRDFDHMIDAAFSNLKIEDVVSKLEDLAKIFKTREVPRQLSIVDIMLDSLGLASYFPSLSEATNKALESNNYISTRIEDILSKLRGSMKTNNIDLMDEGGSKNTSPVVEEVKRNIEEDESKEKLRKQMRKNKENDELDNGGKTTPEIEITEDLSQPISPVKQPAPEPVAPATLPVEPQLPLI